MTQMIFVNLPVADLERSKAFYEAIGFRNDPRFSDDTAAGMTLSDSIHVMLLTHDKWRQFTSRAIVSGRDSAQVLLCISRDDRAAVDATIDQAAAAGGGVDPTPVQDFGVMYGRSFDDPDGHIWEVMWMDVAAFTGAAPEQAVAA